MNRLALLLPLLLAAGCDAAPDGHYQGYVEAEQLLVAAPLAGRLVSLAVERGQPVESGAMLFTLEQESERAVEREAESRLQQSRAEAANLGKGRRAQEIAVIQGQLDQARAQLKLSGLQLERVERLRGQDVISQAELDSARAARDRDTARVRELSAQLASAKLAAREDEIAAGQARVAAAEAALSQARWQLQQKTVPAPAAGRVFDTLYEVGEWVPAGAPVVSLLPPSRVKIRFYVPQTELGRVRAGMPVRIRCDGCAQEYAGRISYIALEAEFTPPVIYSEHARAKLVFLVEARPDAAHAARLNIGQPVDVSLAQP